MLPGFRFLFITTVLSVSVLVFAVGAAALLRATHDNFATFPAHRTPKEQVFVKTQSTTPVIAMLRVEPEPERGTNESTAEKLTSEAMVWSETTASQNFPEPPAPAVVDLDMLQKEVTQSTAAPTTDVSPTSAVAAPEAAPEQTASITPLATDDAAKLSAEQQKKAEADKLRTRKLEAARRAQAARVAAQRRRAAIARGRATRQTQTQTPALFNPPIGAN